MIAPVNVRLRGAERLDVDVYLGNTLMALAYTFGNGLDGDVRIEAETAEGVQMMRGLVLGVGGCTRIAPPGPDEGSLYQEGDECYRQHETARVFLDPRPWGERG